MDEEIKYTCKRTVISTKQARPGTPYALSPLSRQMLKSHFSLLYYFRTPLQKPGETTKTLRDSLSDVLSEYPVMLGRLVRGEQGKWMVKCNDAGLRVIEARLPTTLENWLKRVSREKELKLLHWENICPNLYFWSPSYIQLTEFADGGVAIGLSCSYMIADITAAAAFVKSWADVASLQRSVAPPQCTAIPPFARIDDANNPLIRQYTNMINSASTAAQGKYATMFWRFSDYSIGVLRQETPNAAVYSAFQILSALFWVCISRCKEGKELASMSIRKDARNFWALDAAFFGNMMVQIRVDTGTEATIASACKEIAAASMNVNKNTVTGLVTWLDENGEEWPCQISGCDIICESVESVNPYESVFGCGWIPVKVNCFVEPMSHSGYVLILPSLFEDGPQGRVAIVTLPEEDAAKLARDEMLLRFSPTLMSSY